MSIQERKRRIVEAFASLDDRKKIAKIESLLIPKSSFEKRKKKLNELVGNWSHSEAEEIKKSLKKVVKR